MKQTIVVRDDVELSRGKLAVQVAHGSLAAGNRAERDVFDRWMDEPLKIILRGDDEAHLRELHKVAMENDVPASLVSDAGRTEVEAGTVTVLAIGPADDSIIDRITGSLPLY